MISKSFLKTICLITIMVFSIKLSAQGNSKPENDGPRELKDKTYIIVDNGSVTNIQPYIDAMNNSNMFNHRLKNKRYTIIFKTGLKVELFSANECKSNGLAINPDNYPDIFDATRQEPIFALGADNFIIEYHVYGGKHH